MRSFRPMRPRREALPGLLVLVLIAIAGVLLARGLGELLPEELFETSPFAGLSAEEVAIDPATGLPIVPLPETVIATWTVAEPNSPVDPANHWASTQPPGRADPGQPSVTLMATYPSHEAALAVAEELALAVGDPAAEAAWLSAAGVEPGNGFEWLGPDGSATPFVQVVDRRLLVDGLRWNEAYEPVPEPEPSPDGTTEEAAAAETDARYDAPLALALDASAASLLVEGDRGGDGAIAFDLVCIGDAEPLLTLEQSLADLTDTVPMRPPWFDPALTPEEQRARRTQRLVTELRASAVVQDLLRSAELQPLTVELERAVDAGDREEVATAVAAIETRLAQTVAEQLPGLGDLGQALDAEVLASSLARLSTSLTEPSPADLLEQAEALGAAASGASWTDGSARFEVDAEGRRLWLTRGTWFGVADGYGPLVEYLAANGCDDIRVVFHDLEDVRLD